MEDKKRKLIPIIAGSIIAVLIVATAATVIIIKTVGADLYPGDSDIEVLVPAGTTNDGTTGQTNPNDTTGQNNGNGNNNTGTATKITEDQAIAIVNDKIPGAQITYMKLGRDDGILEYEGSAHRDGIEYEFEINANTGVITEWEADRIG